MGFQSSLTLNQQSDTTLFYSKGFSGCTGILAVAKKENGDFYVKLLHKNAYQTGHLFSTGTLPHLTSIPSNATVVLFVAGEYQKNGQDKWEMFPNEESQQIINKITAKLPNRRIVIKAYSMSKENYKPSNSIAALYNPTENSVKIYTDGYSENPYTPILEIK